LRSSLTYLGCLLLTGHITIAQISLTGKITEEKTGDAIPGVTIYIPDLKKGAVSDIDGNYSMYNLPSRGKFLVEFKSLGYSPFIQVVDIAKMKELNVVLSSAITELNEIVISGVSYSTELKRNPVPISTMNRDALNAAVSTNLIDKVTSVAGVSQIATGPAIGKPVIRGLSYNRIITLFDGVRQEGQQWGDEHGIEIDEFSVDRVEVIKGAGSLLYGSDGLGGVINFIAANPSTEGTIESRIISNYQVNNNLFANSFMNGGNIKGFYWNGRISNKNARAYRNAYDGRVFNSGFSETDYNVAVGLNRSWGYSQMNLSSFDQTLGLVEGERDENGNFTGVFNEAGFEVKRTVANQELNSSTLFLPRQSVIHQRVSNATNILAGRTRIQINTGIQKNKRKEFGNVLSPEQPDLFFDLTTVNYSAIAYLPETRALNFSFGSSGMYQENRNSGVEFLIPQYALFDWGAVAFLKKSLSRTDLAGGIRYDHRGLNIQSLYLDGEGKPTNDKNQIQKFSGAELQFDGISASAGVTFQVSKFASVKSNVSRGYRAPNISELSSNGRHEGSLRYEYGNYSLKPEHSLQADLGWIVKTMHLSTEISIFQNNISNYIFTEKLRAKNGGDSIPDPSQPAVAYQYVQGKARLNGGEISIDLHPHPLDWLHIENALSVVYAVNRNSVSNDTRYLPYIPAPKLQTELRATAKRWKRFGDLFVKLQFQNYWKQNRVLRENGTETPTRGYHFWNAGFGFNILNHKQTAVTTLQFNVMNIFDEAYQNHLSRLKYAAQNPVTGRTGVYNMGRNLSFKVLIPITFQLKKS
jgi:iron complex outermembrane receptor protein